MKCTTPAPAQQLAANFIGNALEAERRLLASGWHDPQGMHDAACRSGLCGASWCDDGHAYVFQHICARHEAGIEPNYMTCLALAREQGVPLIRQHLFELVCFQPEADPTLDELVSIVASNHQRREHARELLAEVSILMRGQGEPPETVTIGTGDSTATTIVDVPTHLKRKGAHGRAFAV